jgi:hypothetical protein
MDSQPYYLSAVIGRKPGSFEIRTTTFSPENLEALLKKDPTAITLAPEGALVTERLLKAFGNSDTIEFERHAHHHRWRYYFKGPYETTPHLVSSISSTDIRARLSEFRSHYSATRFHLLAFVREGVLADKATSSFLIEAIKPRRLRFTAQSAEESSETANRDALRNAREKMLERIDTYTSAELASACDSANVNPSQYAGDLRKPNRIFAVRMGRDWLYPTFQFNHSKKPVEPFSEMKEVLRSLAPDSRGWDRLQWFLDPNIALGGRTPLEVWKEDRARVIEAAQSETWNERD